MLINQSEILFFFLNQIHSPHTHTHTPTWLAAGIDVLTRAPKCVCMVRRAGLMVNHHPAALLQLEKSKNNRGEAFQVDPPNQLHQLGGSTQGLWGDAARCFRPMLRLWTDAHEYSKHVSNWKTGLGPGHRSVDCSWWWAFLSLQNQRLQKYPVTSWICLDLELPVTEGDQRQKVSTIVVCSSV